MWWIAVIAVGLGGVYWLWRNSSSANLGRKLGRAERDAENLARGHERAKKAQAVRARPRRTPEQLLERLRRRTGRSRDTTVPKP